jgi:hypothetical protein
MNITARRIGIMKGNTVRVSLTLFGSSLPFLIFSSCRNRNTHVEIPGGPDPFDNRFLVVRL